MTTSNIDPDSSQRPEGPPAGLTEVRRQEALLKTGALQTAILNSANFSSIATDEKGVIQIFNVGAERMLGFSADDVINRITPADISDPVEIIARAQALSVELGTEIQPGFEALVFKASRGIEDIYELTYIRKDGSRFPAIVSVTALRAGDGAILGYLLIGTDNSARKQIEEQLRTTEESFRLMVESVSDYAIVMLDPQGRVVSWNSGAERIKGYRADEIIGQEFARFYTPSAAHAGEPQRDLDVARGLGRVELEGWRARKDGSLFWANVVVTAIRDARGALRGFAKLTRDLTKTRAVEAELINAKSVAETASLAKSNFLSSMSHELRSPLNAILGFAQLMESDTPPPTVAQRLSIEQILHAGWFLLKLINEILDLAVIESGRNPLSREPVLLSEVLLECREMMEPQGHKRGTALLFPSFETPRYVMADRTRLKQVLINLLSNAIQRQRDAPGRAERPRRGLLPLSDQADQRQRLHGRRGRGARPRRRAGRAARQRSIDPMIGPGELLAARLLIVDDQPANVRLLERTLRTAGYLSISSTTDPRQVCALHQAKRFDLILLDLQMPGFDGFQVMEALGLIETEGWLPVLVLTAQPDQKLRALKAGARDFVSKPFDLAEVLLRVRNLLEVRLLQHETARLYGRVLEEQRLSERLLRNVLPAAIAERLKGRSELEADSFTGIVADSYAEVTVLFADLVGFTRFSETVTAEVLVAVLNDLFTRFDAIADARGLEKIKTIGDSYMAAAGLPVPAADHADRAAHMALDLLEAIARFNAEHPFQLDLRVGLSTGAVVAGVIGRRKFLYDLWGDAVNVASRMESHGLPGRIQLTEATRARLGPSFQLTPRGAVEIKGKGLMETWFLDGRLEPAHARLSGTVVDSMAAASF